MGAVFLGKELDRAVKMVIPTPTSEHHAQQEFSDDYISLIIDEEYEEYEEDEEPADHAVQQLADDIEAQFGYKFKSPALLMSAFTQASDPSLEEVPSHQHLKFLGMSLGYVWPSHDTDKIRSAVSRPSLR
jgi:endoribonuclease Dicer